MSWSGSTTKSAIFQQAMLNPITNGGGGVGAGTKPTTYTSLVADAVKVAVFNDTTTPDRAAAVGSTGFNRGTGPTTSKITGTSWASGGVSVGSSKTWTVDSGSSSLCFQVTAPTAGQTSTANVTLTSFVGAFVYDSTITGGTVASQGMCFNYFGGTQTVTAAPFTILWATPASAAITAIFNISV